MQFAFNRSRSWAAGGFPSAFRVQRGIVILARSQGSPLIPRFVRFKEAEIFLVAVQSQDVARVVALEEMLVVLVWDGGRILREL